jgi:hypothetical protein
LASGEKYLLGIALFKGGARSPVNEEMSRDVLTQDKDPFAVSVHALKGYATWDARKRD